MTLLERFEANTMHIPQFGCCGTNRNRKNPCKKKAEGVKENPDGR
jgi:hypothetical protein